MEVSGELPRKKSPDTHWIGGLVGPRAVVDRMV